MTRLFEHGGGDRNLRLVAAETSRNIGWKRAESNHFSLVVKGRMTLPRRAHCEERKVPQTQQRRFRVHICRASKSFNARLPGTFKRPKDDPGTFRRVCT